MLRGGSRTAATSKVKPLTITIKSSTVDVAAVLHSPLMLIILPLIVWEKTMWPRKKLQKASVKWFLLQVSQLFKWFHKNSIKANQDKCHFWFSLDISTKFLLPSCILESSSSPKLLIVTNDRKLNFKEYVTNQCLKTNRKVLARAQIFPYIPQT